MRLLSGALAIIAALGSLVHAIPLNPAEGLNGNWSNRLSPGVVNTNSAIEIRPQDDPTFSTPTEPGQPPRDRRPFDCQLANTLQLEVLVDCAYTWEHWYQENYLFYLIHISASGQDSRGWYKGIMDNLKGECKYKSECNEKAKMARSPVCFNNYLYGKQEVAGRTLYGLEAAFEMKKWDPGDDNTHCIERAIRKASCDGRVTFQNGTCYKRYGSYQYPFDIQGPLSKGNK